LNATRTPLLSFDGISVEFPGVKALDEVSFEVNSHEIHGLMGENGAGKSTLLKVLSGVQPPSTGSLSIDGCKVAFRSARDALSSGIAVIYQELNLALNMSVAENLMLGHIPSRLGFVARRRLRERALAILSDLGESIDPAAAVGTLPLGQRQMVEIGKALLRDARIIAFDEPTSSLSAREVDNLTKIIRNLKAAGRAIIYVTHRMEEVFQLCDAVTVLRDGARVARHPSISELSQQQLVQEMAGRAINDVYGYRPRQMGEALLKVEALTGPGLSASAHLSLRRGEILGLFGLMGAGRTELVKLLCGAERPDGGSVVFKDRAVRYRDPAAAIRDGIALCPEDRKAEAIFPLASVADNINISVRRQHAFGGMVLNKMREAALADEYIDKLRVRTRNRDTAIATLSGGNQQKVILARWLAERIDLLIVDEPTRGIDVGARSEIYSILYDIAEAGCSVIVVSSDLPEVISICDRVTVMRLGAIVGTVERADATQERLLHMALPQ